MQLYVLGVSCVSKMDGYIANTDREDRRGDGGICVVSLVAQNGLLRSIVKPYSFLKGIQSSTQELTALGPQAQRNFLLPLHI